MALFRLNIAWSDDSQNILVHRFPFKKDGREVNNKSTLTVKESQVAVFVHKGQIADVFGPGLYNLGTEIFPILSKLASWKYGFETPITVDVYFINTKQFTDIKWGTVNPIMMRDPEFGMIRVRGFGAFAFRVYDPSVFLKELFGTNSSFRTDDITGYLKTMVLSCLADVLGESRISAIDLAANTFEFNEIVKAKIQEKFREIGLEMTSLFIENMSVPDEVEKAIDQRSKVGVLKNDAEALMRINAAEAIKDAANNPGGAGAFVGAGVGMGAGMGMGGMLANVFAQPMQQQPNQQPVQHAAGAACCSCGKPLPANSKFCPECGAQQPVAKFCMECGAKIDPNAKFCANCGHKIG
ncbi:MAG: SPFH domain-containing protein [Clostridia bacterium]|nr:SPFH domain-containing protein [Clostridia bacterium]